MVEAGLYFKIKDIEEGKLEINEKLGEQDDEMSAIKLDLNHNNNLLDEENKRLTPLRDRKLESLAKLQKLNLDMEIRSRRKRVKNLEINFKISSNY